jgi:stage III sporulation protein AC
VKKDAAVWRTAAKEDGKPMDVDLIFKIAAIGIIVAVLNQVLIRSGREEQAMMTTLAGLIVVLMMVITQISALFDTIKQLFGLW